MYERPWSTVWRGESGGREAWLKQCASVQNFEPALTVALAARHPGLLPEVLAHDADWMLLADAGRRLGIGGDPGPWLELLPRYAELQRAEVVHVEEHLTAGVPDRRLQAFPALFDRALARWPQLRSVAARFTARCEELAGAGLSETVQHDDLHGNNVYARDDEPLRILDWGDACIGHPFLTLRVTFVHLQLAPSDPWRERLRDAYLEPFGPGWGETFALAQRLAPFAHLFVLTRLLDHGLEVRDADLKATLAECVNDEGPH